MSYLALYRKFRPSGFEGVIGQDHVVETLKNQIKYDKIGHAYLFCGARGTGKTSLAKILARAINCQNPKDGSPCGECEACVRLANDNNLDIIEMDGASNNKVENIREMREKIQYAPSVGRFKVYIIDEVHMLTTEAFNALLKTLEEPPSHAVFILATTESQKLPKTILSRCMRFDLKLVSTEQIASHIEFIYKSVSKEFDRDAVVAIAKAGEGSVRDALSVADVCMSVASGKITYSDVLKALGGTDDTQILNLISFIITADIQNIFVTIENLASSGRSMSVLNKSVLDKFRDLLICKTVRNANDVLYLNTETFNRLNDLSKQTNNNFLLRAVEIFSLSLASLKYSDNPKIVFQTACIKSSMPSEDFSIDALLVRIKTLEDKLEKLKAEVLAVHVANNAVKQPIAQLTEQKQNVTSGSKIDIANNNSTKSEQNKSQQMDKQPEIKEDQIDKLKDKKTESEPCYYDDFPLPPAEGYDDPYADFAGFDPFFNEYNEKPKSGRAKREVVEQSVTKTSQSNNAQQATRQESSIVSQSTPKANQVTRQESSIVSQSTPKVEPSNNAQQATRQEPIIIEETRPINPNRTLVEDGKVWGNVLIKLRKEGMIMLWSACSDLKARIENHIIYVLAETEPELEVLNKPHNFKAIQDAVSEFSNLSLKVVSIKVKEANLVEDGVEKLKRMYGKNKVIEIK